MHELELLKSIYASASQSSDITIGPGDDMGELQIGSERILCAIDHLILGRHVAPKAPPASIGRKAIARCFSDIAAMAAHPIGSLMTACIPSDMSNDWCEQVFDGAKIVAEQWGGPIFGGDIASCNEAPPIFTVTAFATPPKRGAILRTGAEVGDYICVTGELGNSQEAHHLTFTPRIEEAQKLLQVLGEDLHSMIDISDGLGQDASHLASDTVQLVVEENSIPLRAGATIQGALCEGEDYELLFTSKTIPPSHLATVIGSVCIRKPSNPAVITSDGVDISSYGWSHT